MTCKGCERRRQVIKAEIERLTARLPYRNILQKVKDNKTLAGLRRLLADE